MRGTRSSPALETGPGREKRSRSTHFCLWTVRCQEKGCTSMQRAPEARGTRLLLPACIPFCNPPSWPASSQLLILHRHPLQEVCPQEQPALLLMHQPHLCFSASRPPSVCRGFRDILGATALCLRAEYTGEQGQARPLNSGRGT